MSTFLRSPPVGSVLVAATKTPNGRDFDLPKPDEMSLSGAEDAARYIRRLIFQGDLKGGMKIPQDEIAAALNRSRIPVREALIALEREGWVTARVNHGASVARFTPGSIRDHYELLGFTYGLAARRAVENQVDDLPKRLEEITGGMKDVDDTETFLRAALAFHDAVVDAAGSPRIRSVLRSMSAIVPGNFFAQVPGSAAVEQKAATAIRRAIARGDGNKAADEYAKMLRKHGDMVVELLDARGFFDVGPNAA